MKMRVLCGTVCAMMLAGMAMAWTPGGEYAGAGTSSTNAVYDPFLGNILPMSMSVTVIGRISSNDVAFFTDRSGRFLRGTNLIGQVQGWAAEAATGAVAQAAAAYLAATQAQATATSAGAVASAALPRAETNGWTVSAHQAWITNETDAVALEQLAAYAATNQVIRWQDSADTSKWWVAEGGTNLSVYQNQVSGTNFALTLYGYAIDFIGAPWVTTNFPLSIPGSQVQGYFDNGLAVLQTGYNDIFWSGASVDPEFPQTIEGLDLYPDGATVSIASYNYSPVKIASYNLSGLWSVADQLAWMDDGNAGELWVTELSGAVSMAVLNGHTSLATTPRPHPQYVVNLNGAATNLTLTGATAGGDPLIGAGAVTGAVRAAQAWLVYTNAAGAVTITNQWEAPVFLHATGAVTVAWAGLRSPNAVYLVARGMESLEFPGAYGIGGGSFQTNQSNHFVFWSYGTNVLFNAITTTED